MKTILMTWGALLIIFWWLAKLIPITLSRGNCLIAFLVTLLIAAILYWFDPVDGRYQRTAP